LKSTQIRFWKQNSSNLNTTNPKQKTLNLTKAIVLRETKKNAAANKQEKQLTIQLQE